MNDDHVLKELHFLFLFRKGITFSFDDEKDYPFQIQGYASRQTVRSHTMNGD